jgi:hypothetical protein
MRAYRSDRRVVLDPYASLAGDSPFPSKNRSGCHITKLNNPHNRVCAKLSLDANLYDFRHTFATRAGESGTDIKTLADIMGHANLRTVARNIHPGAEHKRGGYDPTWGLPRGAKRLRGMRPIRGKHPRTANSRCSSAESRAQRLVRPVPLGGRALFVFLGCVNVSWVCANLNTAVPRQKTWWAPAIRYEIGGATHSHSAQFSGQPRS